MKKTLLILAMLVCIEVVYGFAFQTHNDNYCWRPLSILKTDESALSHNSVIRGIQNMIGSHRIYCDGENYLTLAYDFPNDYFRGNLAWINRPLYSFLVFALASPLYLISHSYITVFIFAIALNMFFTWLAAVFLYSLARRYFSHDVALAAAALFALSPLVRAWLTQPEVTIFTMFSWVFFLWLLARYVDNPSKRRLYGYSLVVGILFLGKLFFLISLFALATALYFKRYREGVAFCVVHLLPIGLWLCAVLLVWKLPYVNREITEFGAGIWILYFLENDLIGFFERSLSIVKLFIESAAYAFMVLPLPLAAYGFMRTTTKFKYFYVCGVAVSLFAMIFVMGYSIPRYAFLLFPVVYPLAAHGLMTGARRIEQRYPWFSHRYVWYSGIIAMVFLASMDVVRIYRYMGMQFD